MENSIPCKSLGLSSCQYSRVFLTHSRWLVNTRQEHYYLSSCLNTFSQGCTYPELKKNMNIMMSSQILSRASSEHAEAASAASCGPSRG